MLIDEWDVFQRAEMEILVVNQNKDDIRPAGRTSGSKRVLFFRPGAAKQRPTRNCGVEYCGGNGDGGNTHFQLSYENNCSCKFKVESFNLHYGTSLKYDSLYRHSAGTILFRVHSTAAVLAQLTRLDLFWRWRNSIPSSHQHHFRGCESSHYCTRQCRGGPAILHHGSDALDHIISMLTLRDLILNR
jgi:hypothetical protein